MLHLLWIVPLLLLIFFLSSPRFRGDIAETRTRRLLRHGLERNLYTVFDGLVLPVGGGTIAVEHVVVSRFGIFVIHSEYVRGWISGGELQQQWNQKRLARTVRFENPIHRNRLQVEAVQRLLDYPAAVFHPLVVLVGQDGFKKAPPEKVVPPGRLLAQIRKKTRHVLTPEQADRAVRRIDEARLRSGRRRPLVWLRLLLLVAVLAGAWLAFRDDIQRMVGHYRQEAQRQADPAAYHPDGRRKTEQERWEDSLICAYSIDTGRCACYEPSGARTELDEDRCRELAERGSVLKQ